MIHREVSCTERKFSAPAVEKMLSIIELLAESDGCYSINEIARLTGSPVNTVYRICGVLYEHGYLFIDEKTGFYAIGSRFYKIGKAAEKRMTLNEVSLPVLRELVTCTGESVQLITLCGEKAVVREQVETSEPIRIHVETCSIVFPHCSAAGKCILAFLPEEELKTVLREPLEKLTEHTVTDRESLKRELCEIREKRYAFDREESMRGLRCIGAPVFGKDGSCIAGIDVMYPAYRVDTEKERQITCEVIKAAEKISEALGYQGK